MLPMSDHPLTALLLAGARSTTAEAMRQATMLARQLAAKMKPIEVEQCKLAADVLIEGVRTRRTRRNQ